MFYHTTCLLTKPCSLLMWSSVIIRAPPSFVLIGLTLDSEGLMQETGWALKERERAELDPANISLSPFICQLSIPVHTQRSSPAIETLACWHLSCDSLHLPLLYAISITLHDADSICTLKKKSYQIPAYWVDVFPPLIRHTKVVTTEDSV